MFLKTLGLGNAWFFQARDYYFKDDLNLDPAEAQAYIAAAHTPWNSTTYSVFITMISYLINKRLPFFM
jgi:hypothetical protein